MQFVAFDHQAKFLHSNARIRAALAGRRGGKTEIGAIEAILHTEQRRGYTDNSRDPYIGVIIAPTHDMLRRISMKKFLAFAKPFGPKVHKTHFEVTWPNGAIVYGISADKPERLEGIKAHWIWLDEVLQMPEQIFLEALARVADTEGRLWCTGSLGVQYRNPKQHWVHQHFIDRPIAGSEVFTWPTAENPHFPREELERLKSTLDARTYKALFELSWDVQAKNMVYDEFSEENIQPHTYNPAMETSVCVDWGWTHKMVALFVQYHPYLDTVYFFDEIASSKMTLEQLYAQIKAKPYKITNYYCDISGNQEREQTGISNVTWFKNPPRNIHFRYRPMGIAQSIAVMRSYIKNSLGQRRMYVDPRCSNLIDGIRNYSYEEKDGKIVNELPMKANDDEVDCARYYFGNRLDFTRSKDTFVEVNRWRALGK